MSERAGKRERATQHTHQLLLFPALFTSEQSSRHIPCSSSWAQGSTDLLHHYSTTAATSTRRSVLVLGGRDRVGNSHENGRFPNRIVWAPAQSCADGSRSKFQDRRVPPHSKIRNDLDRPAPATSTRSPCWYLDVLCKVVGAGDECRHKSSWKTSLGPSPSLSRAEGGDVAAKAHGRSRSMGRRTCAR